MMLLESNALEMAQADGRKISALIEKGATLDQISKRVLVLSLRKIGAFDSPAAVKAAQNAVNAPRSAGTYSEQISARLLALYEAAIPRLHPEDSRALGLYLIGFPPDIQGLIQHLVFAVGESSGESAVQICIARIQAKLDRMQAVDQKLFQSDVKALNQAKQHVIAGHLLQAQWTFHDKDGVGTRDHVILARRLALQWLREEKERA